MFTVILNSETQHTIPADTYKRVNDNSVFFMFPESRVEEVILIRKVIEIVRQYDLPQHFITIVETRLMKRRKDHNLDLWEGEVSVLKTFFELENDTNSQRFEFYNGEDKVAEFRDVDVIGVIKLLPRDDESADKPDKEDSKDA